MAMLNALKERRTVYALDRNLPVSFEDIEKTVKDVTELVPDAFNMKSSRVVIVKGDLQDTLWDKVYDAFGGMVTKEKLAGFKAAYGTILYFIDEDVVTGLQEQYPLYKDNFPVWANQSSGMLQLAIWSAFAEQKVGANLQHYNPVIDESVKSLLELPASWKLVAEMPFGGIVERPAAKEAEDISKRVIVK